MKARSTILVSVITLLLLLAVPALALADSDSVAAGYRAAPADVTLSRTEQMLVDLVNRERAKRGLAKLSVNVSLVDAARAHSTEMGTRQYFSHDSAGGETFARRIIRYGYVRSGYSFWKVGENIGWGSGLYASAPAMVDAWMKSPAHKAVILTRCFRQVGVGAVVCDRGYGACDSPVTFFTLDVGRRIK
jgi:uncharacterized protein YkwD